MPVGHGQTISQPYIVALMTEALSLSSEDRVLEIGTGSGYQTAILSRLVKEVISLERLPGLMENAQRNLEKLGVENCTLICQDGFDGWPASAPYQAILLAAALREIPPSLLQQLARGGRMILPLEAADGQQVLTQVIKRSDESLESCQLLAVRFVPFVHEQ